MKKQNITNLNIKNSIFEAILEYIDNFNVKFSETKETFKKARLSTSDRKENCVKDFFLSILLCGYSINKVL